MKTIQSDILIIGSGIAGLFMAVQSNENKRIHIITKAALDDGNTRLAQGGIACVTHSADEFESHIQDTLVAGAMHGNPEAIRLLVTQAPTLIQELIQLGVDFSMENQILNLGREGGHTHHRIIHAADITGSVIQAALVTKVKSQTNTKTFEYFLAIELVIENSKCCGVIALDLNTNEKVFFQSNNTIIATGGCGQVYQYTTNPSVATGDGYALAKNAGVKMKDMEFMQFHPTMLHHSLANGFLISEAVRGAGAELVLPNGDSFMQFYHPLKSLAPRDIVSRAMFEEMIKHQCSHLYLDATNISEETLENHFPNIRQTCNNIGIDIHTQPIPVSPAAHFMCGGIETNLKGESSLPGLYAIGEVARTGVHGANRLASNSLLEGLVFAKQAAMKINSEDEKLPAILNFPVHTEIDHILNDATLSEIAYLKKSIQTIMWQHAGIVRSELGLLSGKIKLNIISDKIKLIGAEFPNAYQLIELKCISVSSECIIDAARERHTSLGTHYLKTKSKYFKEEERIQNFLINKNTNSKNKYPTIA